MFQSITPGRYSAGGIQVFSVSSFCHPTVTLCLLIQFSKHCAHVLPFLAFSESHGTAVGLRIGTDSSVIMALAFHTPV